ncbi:MAG: hypothetical protein O3A01_04465 [bacterium]|nr:hypothetical protein [bacterium]
MDGNDLVSFSLDSGDLNPNLLTSAEASFLFQLIKGLCFKGIDGAIYPLPYDILYRCNSRAYAAHFLLRALGYGSAQRVYAECKVNGRPFFAHPRMRLPDDVGERYWSFHVASQLGDKVFDPALFSEPVDLESWLKKMSPDGIAFCESSTLGELALDSLGRPITPTVADDEDTKLPYSVMSFEDAKSFVRWRFFVARKSTIPKGHAIVTKVRDSYLKPPLQSGTSCSLHSGIEMLQILQSGE